MISFLIFLVVSGISIQSYAFTLNPSNNSNFKGWPSNEVNFVINSASCPTSLNVEQIVKDSFETWNQVPTSRLKLSVTGTTTSTASSNPTVVFCSVNFASDLGVTDPTEAAQLEDSVPGVALLSMSGDFAVSGQLILNASGGDANIGLFNQTILKVILAHEVGHIIGLGHSHDTNALMYYNASAKNTLALAQDDMDGVTYLYPRNELSGDKMMGCGLVRDVRMPPPADFGTSLQSLAFILLFLMIPILTAAKLGRRLSYENDRESFS